MRDYRQICDEFRWELPQDCNMAVDVCLRHAEDDVALIHPRDSGEPEIWHFGDFARESAKLGACIVRKVQLFAIRTLTSVTG